MNRTNDYVESTFDFNWDYGAELIATASCPSGRMHARRRAIEKQKNCPFGEQAPHGQFFCLSASLIASAIIRTPLLPEAWECNRKVPC